MRAGLSGRRHQQGRGLSDEEKYRAWSKLVYHIGTLLEKSGGYHIPWDITDEHEAAKDKAFNLMRDNFFDLWW